MDVDYPENIEENDQDDIYSFAVCLLHIFLREVLINYLCPDFEVLVFC